MKQLGKLEKVDLRDVWKHEATDFSAWLALPENLDALAEQLGIEIEPIGTEVSVGRFKIDILAREPNTNEQIIIENQLEPTNHDHLGKVITYAAGIDARYLIWIVKDVLPEHLKAIEWLNDHLDDAIRCFLIRIEVWKIGTSIPAPKFEVIVKPDNWSKSNREEANSITDSSPARQLKLKFWQAIHKKLSESAPQLRMHTPKARHYLNSSSLRPNIHLGVAVNIRDERIYVELYLGGEEAKARFAHLLAMRKEIESKLGFDLEWMELPDAKASRLASFKEDSSIEDEDRWEEYLDWSVKKMIKMDQVFRPIVKSIS